MAAIELIRKSLKIKLKANVIVFSEDLKHNVHLFTQFRETIAGMCTVWSAMWICVGGYVGQAQQCFWSG